MASLTIENVTSTVLEYVCGKSIVVKCLTEIFPLLMYQPELFKRFVILLKHYSCFLVLTSQYS